MNIIDSEEQYMYSSQINQIEPAVLNNFILSHPEYLNCLNNDDPNQTAILITQIINDAVSLICPKKLSKVPFRFNRKDIKIQTATDNRKKAFTRLRQNNRE